VKLATDRPNPMNASLLARPARACLLMSGRAGFDWRILTIAAIASISRLWGSQATAILPVPETSEEKELFWALASLLDPDVYLHHQPSWADLAELLPDAYANHLEAIRSSLRNIGAEESLADLEMQRPVAPVPLPEELSRELVERTAPLHNEGELMYMPFASSGEGIHPLSNAVQLRPLPNLLTECQPSTDPLERLLLAATFGELSPQLRRELVAAESAVVMRALPHRHELMRWLFSLGGPGWQATPRTLGMQGLDWFGPGSGGRPTATIVLGESPWDFALLYALRATRCLAWWLPPSYFVPDGGIESARSLFVGLTRKWIQVSTTSTSDPDAARAFAASLTGPGFSDSPVEFREWRETLPSRANRLVVRASGWVPQPLYLQDGLTPRLNTPVPALGAGTEDLELRWMTEARVESGWPLVRHPQLAAGISENDPSSTARTSAEGFAYLGPGMLVLGGVPLEVQSTRPRLAPLSLMEQIEAIASASSWRADFSEKGEFCIAASVRFGGLDELCAALRRSDLAAVLMSFLDGGGDAPGAALKDRRRYVSSAEITDLAGDGGETFEELADKQILTGGFVLKCPRCRYAAWYRPREVDPCFSCRRCATEHKLDKTSRIEADEPTWRYQLDETVFQFLRHRGDLPLLAANRWCAGSRLRDGVLPEVELFDPNGVKTEIDFVVADGADLWVGEAFSNDRYAEGEAEVARLAQLAGIAELLNARGIVLATAANALRATSVERAAAAVPGPWPVLEVLSGCELLARPEKLLDDGARQL